MGEWLENVFITTIANIHIGIDYIMNNDCNQCRTSINWVRHYFYRLGIWIAIPSGETYSIHYKIRIHQLQIQTNTLQQLHLLLRSAPAITRDIELYQWNIKSANFDLMASCTFSRQVLNAFIDTILRAGTVLIEIVSQNVLIALIWWICIRFCCHP